MTPEPTKESLDEAIEAAGIHVTLFSKELIAYRSIKAHAPYCSNNRHEGRRLVYRTYDNAWNRTGYSEIPQYPGQEALDSDFPAKCPSCGGEIVGMGSAAWLDLVGRGPKDAHSHQAGYVAWCKKQHTIEQVPISELMG